MPQLTHVNSERLKAAVSLKMNINGSGRLGHLIWSQREKIPDYNPRFRYVIYCANTYYDITNVAYEVLGPDYE